MKYFLLITLLYSSLLSGDDDADVRTSPYYSFTEQNNGETVATSCVNVATGSFCEQAVDLYSSSMDGFSFSRMIDTADTCKKVPYWQFMPELWVSIYDDASSGCLGLTNGSRIALKKESNGLYKAKLDVPGLCHPVGIDAGQKDYHNISVSMFNNCQDVRVQLGDGTIRIYGIRPVSEGTNRQYRLVREEQPNGFVKEIEYATVLLKKEAYPSAIKIFTKTGKLVSEARFEYTTDKRGTGDNKWFVTGLKINFSNGQRITYEGDSFGLSTMKLHKGVSNYAPHEEYAFISSAYSQIQAQYFPTHVRGLYRTPFHVEYYQETTDFFDIQLLNGLPKGKVKYLHAPVGTNGAFIPIYGYKYNLKTVDHVVKGGETEVWDVYRHIEKYHFDENFLSKKVQCKNRLDFTEERYVWSDSGKDGKYLLGKSFGKYEGDVYSFETYRYNDHHNLVDVTIWGNLTGKGKEVVSIGADKLPVKDSVESYTKHYAYTNDAYNLLERETDGRKAVYYEYLPSTNRCSKELLFLDDRISQRTFYFYNEDLLLVKKVTDNGSESDYDNLSHVTVRKVESYSYNNSFPYVTHPDCIEEKCYNFVSRQEKLLRKTKLTYGSFDKVTKKEYFDADCKYVGAETFVYDEKGRLIQETNLLGHQTAYSYNDQFDVISKTGPIPGHRIDYTYDAAGRPIQEKETYPDGTILTRSYEYDLLSRKTACIDECGNKTAYVYDEFGRVVKTIYPKVNGQNPIEEIDYDIFDRPVAITKADGSKTLTRYNISGKPIEITHPNNSKEHFTYNLDGTLAEHINAAGLIVRYTYDGLGRVVKKALYNSSDYFLSSTESLYDAFNLLEEKDSMGVVTYYDYDYAGRLISKIKESQETRYTYDSLGRVFQEIQVLEGGKKLITEMEYDLLNRVISKKIKNSSGDLFFQESYAYNEAGHKTGVIVFHNNEPCTTTTVYNPKGNPLSITDPEGYTTTFSYQYNPQGLIITKVSPDGTTTVEEKDALGRSAHTYKKDPAGKLILEHFSTYDLMGRRTRLLQRAWTPIQKDIIVEWTYTNMGQVETLKEAVGTPEEKVTKYAYDSAARLEKIFKPSGIVIHNTYDPRGMVVRVTSSDDVLDYNYTYNNNLQITRVVEKDESFTEREYDSLGRLTKEKLKTGLITSYVYDNASRVIQKILPDSSVIEYSYLDGNLRQICYGNQTIEYDGYDLAGSWHLLSMPFEDVSRSTDCKGRVVNLSSNHFTDQAELFDSMGNMLQRKIQDAWGKKSIDYQYNFRNELTYESSLDGNDYSYDEIGNRISKNEKPYSLNSLNQVLSDSTLNYTYDKDGNLISDGDACYEYDPLDRLVRVYKDDQCLAFYYDVFNRRVAKAVYLKTSSGLQLQSEEYAIYDGDCEIGTTNKQRQVQQLRILGLGYGAEIGAAVLIKLDGKLYAPLHDLRGNVVALINNSNKVSQAYRYTTFGEQEAQNENIHCPWQYASKRYESELDLVYFGRRYYSPNLGRWITQDPKGYSAGFNLYNYVLNNPLTTFDLYGLEPNKYEYRSESRFRTGSGGYSSSGYARESRYSNSTTRSPSFSRKDNGQSPSFTDYLMCALLGGSYAYEKYVEEPRLSGRISSGYIPLPVAMNEVAVGRNIAARASSLSGRVKPLVQDKQMSDRFWGAVKNVFKKSDRSSRELFVVKSDFWMEGSPFKGKSAQELNEMFLKKGFDAVGKDCMGGYGNYINPKTGRQFHIDPKNVGRYREPNHVDVSRPKDYTGELGKKRFGYLDD